MNLSKKKKIMLAVGTVLFLAVVCGFVAVMAIGGNREGNAQEQLSLGERYLAEMDYERAVAAFELAIELEPRNIDAYIGLARAYDGLGDTDLALETLETAREKIQELVREGEALPDSAAEVYLMLVRMYEETGNYEEARLLLEEALSVTDSAELQEIWEAYMPEVEFSLAAGEYEEGTELTLTTDGQAVYYTLDGSDPVKDGEGTAEVVIVLQEGNWTIRAAAEGRGGMLGDVTAVEYVVVVVESTEGTEPEGENTEVPEESVVIKIQVGEALASSGLTSDVATEIYWSSLFHPTGNRNITGTITVLADDTDDILVERNFDLSNMELYETMEIEVPCRERYTIDVSAEGYVDAKEYVSKTSENTVGLLQIGLTPIGAIWSDVVEIRFLDTAGNSVYPDNWLWYYNNYTIGGSIMPGFLLEHNLYVRYLEGFTVGIGLCNADGSIQPSDYIYPIIPDENGIAYITLSDYDMENMPYQY